jgi:exopolysaccharide biosynthesis polyprenyl glycosylphosphotransferase
MLGRRPRSRFLAIQLVSDLLAVSAGLLIAYWIRFESQLSGGAVVATAYSHQFIWALGAWIVALAQNNCYQNHPRLMSFNRARRVLLAGVMAVMIMVAFNYFTRTSDVSRLLYPLSLIFVSALVIFFRLIAQKLAVHLMLSGPGARSRILIVGTGPVARRLSKRAIAESSFGFDLIGYVTADNAHEGENLRGRPVLGTLPNIREIIATHHINEVFITAGNLDAEQIQRVFIDAELESAIVHVVPSLFEIMRTQIYYDEIAGVPVYSIKQTPLHGWNVVLKRVFDLALSLVGIVVLSPLMLVVYLLVRRDLPGVSPIYRQKRLSLDGREFDCFKFRTMPEGSDTFGDDWGNQNHPKATRFGNTLRRWNIDELPQLANVLSGEMSLVGPRPERPAYVSQFKEAIPRYMARHAVKTGITGWAQVHGLRGDTSIPVRLQYDLYYVENWSLWLDIKIIFMTFIGRKTRSSTVVPGDPSSAEAAKPAFDKEDSHPPAMISPNR